MEEKKKGDGTKLFLQVPMFASFFPFQLEILQNKEKTPAPMRLQREEGTVDGTHTVRINPFPL